MNIFAIVKAGLLDELETMKTEGIFPPDTGFHNVTVEPPREAAHGDMATNAAMVLTKPAKMKPRDLAERIVARLVGLDMIETAEIAGPGFINIRLKTSVWNEVLLSVLQNGRDYGRADAGGGKHINVEFVSANPTGPLHIGHVRGAVVGDALASLLREVGYKVTREYYINDGGAQVDVLARSAYLRYLEAHSGETPEFTDGTYPGEYLKPVGEALKETYGDRFIDQPEDVWLEEIREFATKAMLDLIKADLSRLGVEMDHFFSEKSLYGTGKIEKAIAALDTAGLIYKGTLPPPKGKEQDDWEPREQTLFKSTEYGDDVDRPIQKSDGAWTYFAPDIAYHYDKLNRSDGLIDVLGADHGGYVKRMQAAVAALSDNRVTLEVKLAQLVRLFRNGEPFKMSKRAGTFVLLSDVLDEVGPDVTRFVILTRKSDQPLDFDFDKVLEQSKDNPVFYVQYAHARATSVLAKAGIDAAALEKADFSLLTQEHEIGLIRQLASWPRFVMAAADAQEPHRIAFFLYDLASSFHAAQHMGKTDSALRFIVDGDNAQTHARLALVKAVQTVISNGLNILGVTPAHEMR